MRQPYSPGERAHRGGLLQRLDRAFGELNVFLAAFAIGLAILDLTCLYAVTVARPLTAGLHVEARHGALMPGLFPTRQHASEDDPG